MTTVCITSIANWDPPPEIYQRLVDTLDETSRLRIARYRQKRDRLCFLVGRLLLCKHVFNGERFNGSLRLGFGSSGKPYLVEPQWHDQQIEFNISHDDDIVMLAVHCVPKDCPLAGVGIDVMRLDPSGADAQGLEEVLLDQLHPSELAIFRRTDERLTGSAATRLDYLIRMWTVKEAYTKATGTGLGTDFRTLCVEGLDRVHRESSGSIHLPSRTHSTRISIYESAEPPSLAPPIQQHWNVKHGYLAASGVTQDVIGDLPCKSETILEKRFAWSLVTAYPASHSVGAIEFEIIDCRDLEKQYPSG